MNTTNKTSRKGVFGAFSRSGFFKGLLSMRYAHVENVRPRYYEAATAAQAARLIEVFGR